VKIVVVRGAKKAIIIIMIIILNNISLYLSEVTTFFASNLVSDGERLL
jgi:hypothetical protein